MLRLEFRLANSTSAFNPPLSSTATLPKSLGVDSNRRPCVSKDSLERGQNSGNPMTAWVEYTPNVVTIDELYMSKCNLSLFAKESL